MFNLHQYARNKTDLLELIKADLSNENLTPQPANSEDLENVSKAIEATLKTVAEPLESQAIMVSVNGALPWTDEAVLNSTLSISVSLTDV